VIKLPRSKDYDNKGKSHLLHVGVDKEREYILNWMREEYGKKEPYNVSEGIWIVLADHINLVEESRDAEAFYKERLARKKSERSFVEYTNLELKDTCKAYGLPSHGSRRVKISRLLQAKIKGGE
tara:strand:+ start:8764 stop:9135 length:372 start_codon:yes stop_codon:yes gene_type:complete